MSDISNETVGRAANGDMQAFEEIYRATSAFVYNIALRMTNNSADADEVTQEAFIRIHKNLRYFGYRSAFRTWVYRVAVNTALNFCKKRSRIYKGKTEYDPVHHDIGVDGNQRSNLDNEDIRKDVNRLLGYLDTDQRTCIVLREIEGLEYKEIADTLGINLNTVRSRLKRAREKIIAVVKGGMVS